MSGRPVVRVRVSSEASRFPFASREFATNGERISNAAGSRNALDSSRQHGAESNAGDHADHDTKFLPRLHEKGANKFSRAIPLHVSFSLGLARHLNFDRYDVLSGTLSFH